MRTPAAGPLQSAPELSCSAVLQPLLTSGVLTPMTPADVAAMPFASSPSGDPILYYRDATEFGFITRHHHDSATHFLPSDEDGGDGGAVPHHHTQPGGCGVSLLSNEPSDKELVDTFGPLLLDDALPAAPPPPNHPQSPSRQRRRSVPNRRALARAWRLSGPNRP